METLLLPACSLFPHFCEEQTFLPDRDSRIPGIRSYQFTYRFHGGFSACDEFFESRDRGRCCSHRVLFIRRAVFFYFRQFLPFRGRGLEFTFRRGSLGRRVTLLRDGIYCAFAKRNAITENVLVKRTVRTMLHCFLNQIFTCSFVSGGRLQAQEMLVSSWNVITQAWHVHDEQRGHKKEKNFISRVVNRGNNGRDGRYGPRPAWCSYRVSKNIHFSVACEITSERCA